MTNHFDVISILFWRRRSGGQPYSAAEYRWGADGDLRTPSGWHLLGQIEFTTFDSTRSPPVVLEVGDFIRFEPI